jgi:uncharacterized DUF497 family protein
VEYEWDEAKAAANLCKHGISFTAAARALDDPRKLETLDDSLDYGEDRIQSIRVIQESVLFVITVNARRERLPCHQRPEGNAT